MPNMSSKVGRHNNKIEAEIKEKANPRKKCSCTKRVCEWGGDCLREGVVYKGEQMKNGEPVFNYIGMTGGNPKARQNIHHQEWSNVKLRDRTKLSTKIWELKEANEPINIRWSKLAYAKPVSPMQKICNLCCKEAHFIMKRDNKSINKREEMGGYCPHRRKNLLINSKINKEQMKASRDEIFLNG